MPDTPIVSGADYLALPRDQNTWVVENILPVGGGLLLFGDPKVGKSFAALQLAECLATGQPWLGFHVPRQVPCVYVQLDTPRTLWADRVDKLVRAGHEGLKTVYFADRDSLNTHPFDITNPDHFRLLSTALATVKPVVVVIDTLRESHSGEENDSTAMQKVISHLEAVVKPAALVLVAHSRKSNPEHGHDLMNDNRGSSYVVGRMDAIVRFSKHSVRYSSRVLEEDTLKLDRVSDGSWVLSQDEREGAAEVLLQQFPRTPVRELARMLADKTKSTEQSCHSFLRRHLERRRR